MAIEALYRTIRSDARQLARRDSLAVIWAYCQFLPVNDFQMPQDIEVAQQLRDARPRQGILAEWTMEHLAREIIRYGDEVPRDGKTLRRWDALAHLANTLRDLEGEIYRDLVGGPNIQLELMRIMHRQFVWQQQRFSWTWIIRYYKLFNTPALTAHAEQATGLSIDQIYLIGMCYLGHFFSEPRWVRRVQVEIPGLNVEHIERFLAFTSLTRTALAEKLRAEHALDEGFAYACFWLCRKLRVDDEFAAMLSTAVSICGVSAAIVACGAIQGDKKKLSYVNSLVLIVAVPMMIVMPWIAKTVGMDDLVAGAWLGGTLDTSASVVAAGLLRRRRRPPAPRSNRLGRGALGFGARGQDDQGGRQGSTDH